MEADIGLIGLGVMGQNLARNMAGHGFNVIVHDRIQSVTDQFIKVAGAGHLITGAGTPPELAASLKLPRRILLMVKAGIPIDQLIEQLVPYLKQGDIIIDGGNSYFKDTIRRQQTLKPAGVYFLGIGISGGAAGALNGPSIMPGGPETAWNHTADLFTAIAAKVRDDLPCCRYIGPDGAGHFVKMVHNGIEYADMQLISETYFLMQRLLGMEPAEMQSVFAAWNQGDLNSYLIEITALILGKKDAVTGIPLVDLILDLAGQKGTGRWMVQEALELGSAIPTIAEAVLARCMSLVRSERITAASQLTGPAVTVFKQRDEFLVNIREALYASKICAYAQGFSMLQAASKHYCWNLNPGEIANIWRGGCIIRAQFLERIKEAFQHTPQLNNLMLDPYFKSIVLDAQSSWRKVIVSATEQGIPIPAFSSALAYYDAYRQARLPANLLQAQRDFFGAHTYERLDRPGTFHTDWAISGDEATSLKIHPDFEK